MGKTFQIHQLTNRMTRPSFMRSSSQAGLFEGMPQRAYSSSQGEQKKSKEENKEEEVEATTEKENHKETSVHKMADTKETKAMEKTHGSEETKAMEGKQEELRGQTNGMLKT